MDGNTTAPVLAWRAWRSAGAAFRANPLLLLLPVLILFGFSFGSVLLSVPYFMLLGGEAGLLVLSLATILVRCATLACVAIAVHRFVLQNETPSPAALTPGRWFRFAAALLAFELASKLLLALGRSPLAMAAESAGLILLFFAGIRLLLMFPAIALDEDAPARQGWQRSAGRFWFFLASVVLTELPVIVVIMLGGFVVLSGRLVLHSAFGLPAIGFLAFGDVVVVANAAAGAAMASWLYRDA